MRLNKFVALATGFSRRKADELISSGHIFVNDVPAEIGEIILEKDTVTFNGQLLKLPIRPQTIIFHKPRGVVVSRRGQGSRTIYDLLPKQLHPLKPIGRLDKDSSGLLLLTNDGNLANELTHPSFQKEKVYEVSLDKKLSSIDVQSLLRGVEISDGPSKFIRLKPISETTYEVVIAEGRNRQIRRTFDSLNYKVTGLHRTKLGSFELGKLAQGSWRDTAKI